MMKLNERLIMSDELSIQQQKSGTPYLLGGSVIGGLAGYGLGAHGPRLASSPAKYKSYEDLIYEKQDDFVKSTENVSEDLKTTAEKMRNDVAEARKTYEADLHKYIGENTKELPADDELMKKMQEAEKALNEKRELLIKQEADKIRKAGPTITETAEGAVKKQATLKESLEYYANKLNKAAEKLEKLRGSHADKNAISAAVADVEAIEAKLEAMIKQVVEKMEYTGSEKEIQAAKDALSKEIRGYTRELSQHYSLQASVPKQPFIVEHFTNANNLVSKSENQINDILAKIKELTGREIPAADDAKRTLNTAIKYEQAKAQSLIKLEEQYLKVTNRMSKNPTFKEFLAALLTGTAPATSAPEDAILERFMKGLNQKDKEALKKYLKDNISQEAFNDAREASTKKLNDLQNLLQNYNEAQKELNDGLKNLEGIKNRLRSDNQYIKDGILYDKKGKPVVKNPKMDPPSFKLPKGVQFPKDGVMIEYTTSPKAVTKTLTEEQILEKARANVTDDMVKAEKEALEAAKKAVEEKAATLSPKSREQLTKEFVEKNGTVDDAIKKAAEKYKDDLKKLYEGKINNKKLAAIIAGGIVAGLAVGALIKPKHNA